MRKSKQLLSLVLCFTIIFSFLLSAQYISSHRNHRCSEHKCVICQQITNAEYLLNNLGCWIPVTAILLLISNYLFLSLGILRKVIRSNTLVSLKVKLTI